MTLADSIAGGSRVASVGGMTPGRLVLVVATGPYGPDVLLTAARRRLPDLRTFEFPKLFTTRRNGPRDAEVSISRELFRDLEREANFLAAWTAGGHRFGLPQTVRNALMDGSTVVVSVPGHVVSDLQDMCPDLRVVRLVGSIDSARQSLTPQACLRRMMGPRLAQRLEGGYRLQAHTEAVSCADGVADTVRALTEVLARIDREPEHAMSRTRTAGSVSLPIG